MAYEPKTWRCGEVVTANDLNHIEGGIAEASQGGGGSAFIITATGNMPNLTGDKTFAELGEAVRQGLPCFIDWVNGDYSLNRYHLTRFSDTQNITTAEFSSATKYSDTPSIQMLHMAEDGTISLMV